MYAKEIGRNRVMKMLSKDDVMLVDMRTPVEFRDGTIDGAVNLPLRNFLNKVMSVPRTANLILFGNNVKNEDMNMAAKYAYELGFSNIYITDYMTLRED